MKKFFTLFAFILLANFGNSQITLNFPAGDGMSECDGQDPTQNADFQNWIADNTTNILQDAMSGCGTIDAITDDFTDGSVSFNSNAPCDFDITVTWTVTDDCGSAPEPTSATFTIEDTTEPFWDTDPSDLDISCTDFNNGQDVQAAIDDVINGNNGFATDVCDPNGVIISGVCDDCPIDLSGCTGSVSITFSIEDQCGNQGQDYTMTLTVNDEDDPDFLIGGGVIATVECDGTGNDAEIENAVINFISGLTDSDFSDDCTSGAELLASVTYSPEPPPGATSNGCSEQIDIQLTITDNCGNPATLDVQVLVEDNTPPTVVGSIPTLTKECNDPAIDIQAYIDAQAQALITGGGLLEDCSPADVTWEDDWSGNEDCNNSPETVTVTFTDLCGLQGTTAFDIIIEDTQPPTITMPTSFGPFDCDQASNASTAAAAINDAIANATLEDPNGCTTPGELASNVTFNPNPISGDPTNVGGCNYEYLVDIMTMDNCGNMSAPLTVSVTFVDSDPPETDFVSSTLTIDCLSDLGGTPPPLDVIDLCEGQISITPTVDDSGVICETDGVVIYTYDVEDGCGNVTPGSPFTITVNIAPAPGQGLEWINPGTDLPGTIEITLNQVECASEYNFPGCVWSDDPSDPSATTYPFPLQEGVHFIDPCGGAVFTSSATPCPVFPGAGDVVVTYMVDDGCGTPLEHEFTIEFTCANCDGGNGIFCEFCDSARPDGCFTCNVNDLLDGFSSCNPPYGGTIQGPPQPGSLCNGQGVPNNMSWFAFVAGSATINVDVCPSECIPSGGTTGIQAGIYDDCDGDCIAGDGGCPNTLRCISFGLNDLIVGKTYYLFVDGCNGAECQYDITISGQDAYILDDMVEVVAETDCESPVPDRFCPGQTIRFNVNHDGATGNFGPADGPYDPEADLCFEWSFSPELDGATNEIYNQLEDGFVTPDFTLPTVTEETTITVCIEDVFGPCEDQCDDADCVGDCCLDIVIAPLPDEVCEVDVCIEDLLAGWPPAQAFEDVCGGGVAGWLGPDIITLQEVDDNDTLTYLVTDPDCNCEFEQKLKVNVIGAREKEPHTWYMYECEFKELELDGRIEEYEWVQPETGQEVEIDIDFEEECITLFELSGQRDWDFESCDSVILLTVEAIQVFAELTPGPCTSAGTEYFWELLIDDIDDEWPVIQPNYIVQWVDCDDVDFVYQSGDAQDQNPPFNVGGANPEGEYCVRVSYEFTNFNFPMGSPELTASCEEIFGPYNLESDQASPPIIEGDTEFCANDLVGKTFSVLGATSTDVITWNVAGTGARIINETPPEITLDLTDFDFSQGILVEANTACGISSTVLTLSTIPVPVPAIDITSEVCLGDAAVANEINFGPNNPLITEYIWTPTNNNSGGPVEFNSPTPGVQEVFLTVVDANGCMSDPVMASYEVIAPLEAPVVQCGSVSVNSVEFVWAPIDGATGYSIFVITPDNPAGTTIMVDNTVLSYEETGLLIDQTVTITVTALGPPPCGDSEASAPWPCTTQDCPDQLTVFMSDAGAVCENESGVTFPFDLNATILDADGVFMTTNTPPGDYYDLATGIVDPTGLAVGTYVVSSSYNYNGSQCPRQGPTFTLTVDPAPNTDFTLSALEVCVGESITIDDSNVTPVASFDPGIDGSRDGNNNLTWSSPGDKIVSVNVTTVDGCVGSAEQTVTVQDSIILGPITCPSSGLDFVIFEWDDVANAADYSVTYIINGGTPVDTVVTGSMIELGGLGNGTSVQVVVTANPEAGFCDTGSQQGACETSNCPEIAVDSNEGPFCYGEGSGPIDLELVITDPQTGADITADGTIEWQDPRVDANGLFTPSTSPTNEDYQITLVYTDADGCATTRAINVEVIAQPDPQIATIDGFCVDGNGVVELVGSFNNGEDILWEWEGGTATGEGPHDIAFAQGNMQYEVTVTVTNGADANGDICVGTATQTVLVDPLLEAPVFVDCVANNTGVTFEWGPVANASEYLIIVDGDTIGTQDETTYMIPAVPGESFGIEVVAISSNNCGNSSATDDCTATDCPPSTFADIDDVEMCLDGTEMQVQFDAIIMNAPPGNPVVDGAWSGTGIAPNGLFDPAGLSAENNIPLSYSVEYDQNCVYTTSVFVTLYEAPQVTNIDPLNPDCFMDNVGSIVMMAEGGTPPYTYQVDNLPGQDNGQFSPLNPGIYNVTVTDVNGCASNLNFEIAPAIEPDLSIGGPSSIIVGGNGVYTIENFPQSGDFLIGDVVWTATPVDGGEVVIISEGPDFDPVEIDLVTYPTLADGFDLTVTVIFNDDCFQEASVRVDVITTTRYFIPNVFSNNSESDINQSWSMFVSSDNVVVNSVRVYDRWGELVHVKDAGLEPDPNNENRIDLGWAGQWTNEDVNDRPNVEQGVYVYVIDLIDDGRPVVESGDVTVLR